MIMNMKNYIYDLILSEIILSTRLKYNHHVKLEPKRSSVKKGYAIKK